jgi:hypothetical protein
VNGLRDQLFSCTGFALNQYSGVGLCDTFNLFEHRFESRAPAYDPRELAISLVLFT